MIGMLMLGAHSCKAPLRLIGEAVGAGHIKIKIPHRHCITLQALGLPAALPCTPIPLEPHASMACGCRCAGTACLGTACTSHSLRPMEKEPSVPWLLRCAMLGSTPAA